MTRKASATLIGAFVLVAMVLFLGISVFFGAFDLFARKETFVLYFDESVNGLSQGAPVKFKGVPVGRVTEIKIRWNQDEFSSHIPVFIELDVSRIVDDLGVQVDLSNEDEYALQINEGLRATLQLESLISGLLMVELDYYPDASQPQFHQKERILKELPTTPSALAEIGQSATEIVAGLTAIDIGAINDHLVGLLESANRKVNQIDVAGIQSSITGAGNSIRSIAESEKIPQLVAEIQATAAEYKALAERLQVVVGRVDEKIDPVLAEARETNQRLQQALAGIEETAADFRHLLQPESSLRYRFESALQEVEAAADAAGRFIEYLERNPRALLSGKPEQMESKR